MKKFGSWSEQVDSKFRTTSDNKVVTVTPTTTLTGASLTLTLPNPAGTTDVLVGRTSTDTLTNKTLTLPTIASIDNSGTLTLPTGTDTLVGKATGDNFQNKTLTDASNNISATVLTSGSVPDARIPSSNVTQHVGSIDHDSLLNFVANEHIDWTSTSSNFNTSGTVDTGTLDVGGNITLTGTVDGRDVATDGTNQDNHIAASSSVHGLGGGDGFVVGTTATQTLSGKTLDDHAYTTESQAISSNNVSSGNSAIIFIGSGSGPVNTMDAEPTGTMRVLYNDIGSAVTIADQAAGAGSFRTGTGADIVLAAEAAVLVTYKDGHWNMIGGAPTLNLDDILTTRGDIIIRDAANATARLGIGSSGQVLSSDGTDISWSTPAGTGDVTAAAMADHTLIRGDGGAKGIQDSGITIDDSDNVSAVNSLKIGAFAGTNTTYQLQAGQATVYGNANESHFSHMAYYDAGWKSINNIAHQQLHFDNGGDTAFRYAAASTTGSAITWTDNVTIKGSTGNVGIGTVSPDQQLHVFEGDASQTGSANTQLVLENSGHAGLSILSGATSSGIIYFGDSGSAARGEISYNHSTDVMNFEVAGSRALTIDSTGEVNIGGTSTMGGDLFIENYGTDASPNILLGTSTAGVYINSPSVNLMTFGHANTEQGRMHDNGAFRFGKDGPVPEARLEAFHRQTTTQSPFGIESEPSSGNVGVKKFWGWIDGSSARTIASFVGSPDSGNSTFIFVKTYSMTGDLGSGADFSAYQGLAHAHSSGPSYTIAIAMAAVTGTTYGSQTVPTLSWSGANLQLSGSAGMAVEVTVIARKGNFIKNEMG